MSNFGHRAWSRHRTAGPVWRACPPELSSLREEYNTLHVNLWTPSLDSTPYCGTSLASLPARIVILTWGIQHFACQTLNTELGFDTVLRDQSGELACQNCHPYAGNTTLCMSNLGHRAWIRHCTAGPVWRACPPELSSLRWEYNTLHVKLWTPTLDSKPYCGTSLARARPIE